VGYVLCTWTDIALDAAAVKETSPAKSQMQPADWEAGILQHMSEVSL